MSVSTKSRTCAVVHANSSYEGKQGFSYLHGISAESAGATGICMHMLTIPPGGRARAHLHENHETAIYVLSGVGGMWFGENLEEYVTVKACDYIYIPAGIPHLPENPSTDE